MTEEEAREYRLQIYRTLTAAGFEWVVRDAEVQFQEGKEATAPSRRKAPLTEAAFDVDPAPRRPRERLTTTVSYSESEKLRLLADAIHAAVETRAEIEDEILRSVEVKEIIFEPQESAEEPGIEILSRAHRVGVVQNSEREALRADTAAVVSLIRELVDGD